MNKKNISFHKNKKIFKEIYLKCCIERLSFFNKKKKFFLSKAEKEKAKFTFYYHQERMIRIAARLMGYRHIDWQGVPVWNLTNECASYFCQQEIKNISEATFVTSYWDPGYCWNICHINCEKDYKEDRAYECQKIDANCNDCYYFDRIKGGNGICKRDGSFTWATPNYCTSYHCFVHRKDGGRVFVLQKEIEDLKKNCGKGEWLEKRLKCLEISVEEFKRIDKI